MTGVYFTKRKYSTCRQLKSKMMWPFGFKYWRYLRKINLLEISASYRTELLSHCETRQFHTSCCKHFELFWFRNVSEKFGCSKAKIHQSSTKRQLVTLKILYQEKKRWWQQTGGSVSEPTSTWEPKSLNETNFSFSWILVPLYKVKKSSLQKLLGKKII